MSFIRTYQFSWGVLFLFFAAAFTFGDGGLHWMWRDTPVVGAVLLALSIFFWVLLVREVRRRGRSDESSAPTS